MWVVIPIVLGTIGSVPLCLEQHLKTLNINYKGLIPRLSYQVPAILCKGL